MSHKLRTNINSNENDFKAHERSSNSNSESDGKGIIGKSKDNSEHNIPTRQNYPQPDQSVFKQMNNLLFPANSQNLVIIPSNIKGTGFLRTCYDEAVLDGLIGEEEFLEVIDASTKIVSKVYTKKRLADTAGIDRNKEVFIYVSITLAILYFVIIYSAISLDNFILEIISYLMLFISFLIMVPLSLYECLW